MTGVYFESFDVDKKRSLRLTDPCFDVDKKHALVLTEVCF